LRLHAAIEDVAVYGVSTDLIPLSEPAAEILHVELVARQQGRQKTEGLGSIVICA
jgi:hypothetical protein